MSKVIGYIIAIAGMFMVALGMNFIDYEISFLGELPKYFITIAGVMCVIISVFLLKNPRNSSSSSLNNTQHRDLPIFEGDKIIGYRVPESQSKNKSKGKK